MSLRLRAFWLLVTPDAATGRPWTDTPATRTGLHQSDPGVTNTPRLAHLPAAGSFQPSDSGWAVPGDPGSPMLPALGAPVQDGGERRKDWERAGAHPFSLLSFPRQMDAASPTQ